MGELVSQNDNQRGCAPPPLVNTEAAGCSGACSGQCQSKRARVWVLAASRGALALYEKNDRGGMLPLQQSPVVTDHKTSIATLKKAASDGRFDHLLLVGSATDIAWVHSLLPASLAKSVMAEIHYTLNPDWFRPQAPLATELARVLRG